MIWIWLKALCDVHPRIYSVVEFRMFIESILDNIFFIYHFKWHSHSHTQMKVAIKAKLLTLYGKQMF